MSDETKTARVDASRTADLTGRWAAAVCVTKDGEESLWLLSPDNDAAMGCACSTCAPHDQLGPYVARKSAR